MMKASDRERKIKISGLGYYVPDKILTNADLEKMVDTSDEWIVSRTGIRERHIASKDQATSDLAAEACRRAIKDARLEVKDIDLILMATSTPDTPFPSTACWVQSQLKADHIPSLDISAGCTGFLYGLIIAESLILNRTVKRVLLVGAELLTRITNWKDRNTCVLFGDAAGAAVLEEADGEAGLLSHYWKADGNLGDLLLQPAGGTRMPATAQTVAENLHTLHMKGNEVFKHAVKRSSEAALEVLKKANLKKEDIGHFIPHQANIRIIEATAERLKVPKERVLINIDRYGNVSVATIPIGLCELKEAGKLKKGDIVLMDAFGAGFTWAAVAYRW